MIATAFHYWISPSLVNTQLNVDGIHNRVMINIDAKALLYVCIPDTVIKIQVKNAITQKVEEHFQSFKLRSLDVVIPDNNPRYVYAVVPKTSYTANQELDALPTPPQAYLTLLTGKVNIDGTSATVSGASAPDSTSAGSNTPVSIPSEYPTTSYHYIYLGGIIGASETNGTLHERYWQETLSTGSLSQVADALPSQYWIKNGAINITLNALGEPDKISASVASNAVIMAYIPGYDTLGYDSAHNYRRWQLAAYPTAFGDAQQKYIYIAIPRAVSSGSAAADTAYLVFPSQRIGIDGKNQIGEQIGSTQYYYIWLRASISSSGKNGTTARKWLDEDGNQQDYVTINFGSLSTDDSSTNGSESEWWQYSLTTKLVTFLKTITTAAFNYLFAKKADITTLNVTEETVTTQQVVDHTDWGQYTADASGATVRRDASGNWLIETDYLKVRKKATFTNVEIQDVYHVGGQMMLTSASCRVDMVMSELKGGTGADANTVKSYIVLFKKQDNSGQHVDNTWIIGDQAYCNTYNVVQSDGQTGNHFLWRRVSDVNKYPTITTWQKTSGPNIVGKMAPYVEAAQKAKLGEITMDAFIEKWNECLVESKSIRDDAETYLDADSTAIKNIAKAIKVVNNHINAILDGTEDVAMLYPTNDRDYNHMDFYQNGLIAYAKAIDKAYEDTLKVVYHTIYLVGTGIAGKDFASNSDAPRMGDNLVQLGCQATLSYTNAISPTITEPVDIKATDRVKQRRGAMILAGAGNSAPYIYMFKNVGKRWTKKRAIEEKVVANEAAWNAMSSEQQDALLDASYFRLPTPSIQISPAKTVITADEIHLTTENADGEEEDSNIANIFNTHAHAIEELEKNTKNIVEQTDGSFRIWQGEVYHNTEEDKDYVITPDMFLTYNGDQHVLMIDSTGNVVTGWDPEKWTETNGIRERLDDFYIATDGRVWQFKYDAIMGYYWGTVTDEYLIAYINQINEKSRVFLLTYGNTTDVPEDKRGKRIKDATDVASYFLNRDYDIGDMWVSAYYYTTDPVSHETVKTYDNDTLVCVKGKAKGQAFNIEDWTKDNGYGDRINEAMTFINDISADNIITADEKYNKKDASCLAVLFDKVVTTRNSLYKATFDESGNVVSETPLYTNIDYTEYEIAYKLLFNCMMKVFGVTAWTGNDISNGEQPSQPTLAFSTKNTDVYGGKTKFATTIPSAATKINGIVQMTIDSTGGKGSRLTWIDKVGYSTDYIWDGKDGYYYTNIDDDHTFNFLWLNYYDEEATLQDALSSYMLEMTDKSYAALTNMADDNVLTRSEVCNMGYINVQLTSEHTNLSSFAKLLGDKFFDLVKKSPTLNDATRYNALVTAYNNYQQAYLDYYAIAYLAIQIYPKDIVMYFSKTTGGITITANDNGVYPTTKYNRLLLGGSTGFSIPSDGDTLISFDQQVREDDALSDDLGFDFYQFNELYYLDAENKYQSSYCSITETSGVITGGCVSNVLTTDSPASSNWVSTKGYQKVIANYHDAAQTLQNAVTQMSQYIAEEDQRTLVQAEIAASVADNKINANEKRAICQELNNIGSEYKFALEKAKNLLGVDASTKDVKEPTEPAADASQTVKDTYTVQNNLYKAWCKMRIFFELLAGKTMQQDSATSQRYMTDGIAKEIGISRVISLDADAWEYSPGYTFTYDKDTNGKVEDYLLDNLSYYMYGADISTDNGIVSGCIMSEVYGSNTVYSSSYSTGIWYIGRNGDTSKGARSFLDAFNDYYNARDNFSAKVVAYNKYASDHALEVAGQLESAASVIESIVNDDIIDSATEKPTLYLLWIQIKSTYNMYVAQLPSYDLVKHTETEWVVKSGVTCESGTPLYNLKEAVNSYLPMYNNLYLFIVTYYDLFGDNYSKDTKLDKNNGLIELNGALLRTYFTDYYAREGALASAISAYLQSENDRIAADLDTILNDSLISAEEKQGYLSADWNIYYNQYQSLLTKHEECDEWTALQSKYTDLEDMMKKLRLIKPNDVTDAAPSTPVILQGYDEAVYGTPDSNWIDLRSKTVGSTDGTTREDVKKAFTDYAAAYQTYQNKINANSTNALKTIEAAVDDDLINEREKWGTIAPKYSVLIHAYNKSSIPDEGRTSLQQAVAEKYTALVNMMNALHIGTTDQDLYSAKIFYLSGYTGTVSTDMTPLTLNGSDHVSREQFQTVFTDLENALTDLDNDVVSKATTAVDAMASDGIISAGAEKMMLSNIYSQIQTNFANYSKQAQQYGVIVADINASDATESYSGTTLDTFSNSITLRFKVAQNATDEVKDLAAALYAFAIAYNSLEAYINAENIFGKVEGGQTVGGFLTNTTLTQTGTIGTATYDNAADYFRAMFAYYYSAEKTYAAAQSEFVTAQLANCSIDMVKGSITIKADTNIAIDSSKIIIGKGASNNDESLDGCLSIDATTKKAKFNGVIEAEGGSFTGTVNASGGTITGKMDLQKNGFTMSLDPTGNRPSMKIINDTSKAGLEMSSFVSQVGTEIPCIMFSDGSQNKTYLSKDMLTLGTTAGNSDFVQLSPSGLSIVGPAGKIEINLFGESPIIQIYDNAKQTWTTLYQ